MGERPGGAETTVANQQEFTLQQVASERLFVVPDYQRPYAWQDKQLRDLWEDLNLLGSGHHYAGTLVLRTHPTGPVMTRTGTSLQVCDVVDGQQRLTTTMLLMDRIRRRFESLDHEDAPEISKTLRSIYGVVVVDGVERPKIQLGSDLNEYWQGTVLGYKPAGLPTLLSGQQRLAAAADYFDARLDELVGSSVEVTYERLFDLMSRVASGLRFLVYEVGTEAEVGVIFETLNERGRELTELEKIKNYLLYLARQIGDARSDELASKVNTTWSEIFTQLSTAPSVNEDTVLRAHWLAAHEPDARRWRRTQSIKAAFPRDKYIPSSTKLIAPPRAGEAADEDLWGAMYVDISNYIEGLKRCVLFATELHSRSAQLVDFTSDHARARSAGAALTRTRTVAPFYPLIFAARLAYPTDGAFYADIVELCETYAARVYTIAQRRSDAGQTSMNRLAYRITHGLDQEEAKRELEGNIWYWADDHRVATALRSSDAWYPGRSHKYFLYEYERSLAKSADDVPAFEAFLDTRFAQTTEHILPQNPGKSAHWWDDFSVEEHRQLVHTLGNLVLTFNNAKYSNHDYAIKRGTPTTPGHGTCYFNAQLAQEREIATNFERWTPDSIRERQAHLAQWALKRWSVTPPAWSTSPTSDAEAAIEEDAIQDEVLDQETEQEAAS